MAMPQATTCVENRRGPDPRMAATLSHVEQLRVDANGLTFAALAWGDPAS